MRKREGSTGLQVAIQFRLREEMACGVRGVVVAEHMHVSSQMLDCLGEGIDDETRLRLVSVSARRYGSM